MTFDQTAYSRAWRHANPDKCAEAQKRYRSKPDIKKKLKAAAQRRAWNAKPETKKLKAEYNKAYNKLHPEVRARNRAKYGETLRARRLTDPEWRQKQIDRNKNKLLAEREQLTGRPKPEVCDICGNRPSGKRNSERSLHYDHCHERGHFRGWLCARCNLLIGRAGDDPELLMKMAAYLKRARINLSLQLTLPGV